MTVESTTNFKKFLGDGATDEVTFNFRCIQASDLKVYVYPDDLDFVDIENYLLVFDTDYTVELEDDGEGGTITFTTAPAADEIGLIKNVLELTQEADLPTEGNFNETAVETALDRLAMQNIQQQEQINRGIALRSEDPLVDDEFVGFFIEAEAADDRAGMVLAFNDDGDGIESSGLATTDLDVLIDLADEIAIVASLASEIPVVNANQANINIVAGIASEVTTVAGIAANVTTVAGITANIATVAGISANITTVAGISANVTTVAGISSAVSTVSGISSAVSTVSGIQAAVSNVSSISSAVSNVSSISAAVSTVSGISANVTTVAGISANVTTVAGISADVTAVAAIDTEIGVVAGIDTEITTVAGIAAEIAAVAAIDTEITTVAGIDTEITTVSGIQANVTTVAGISGNVTTVAGISANVTTVAGISANVTTVAGISASVSTVAGISASVSTVAGISASVSTVAGLSSQITTLALIASDITDAANNIPKANRSATSAPAVTDDSGDGYSEGSLWVNVNSDTAYLCMDPALGAAVWQQITTAGTTLAALTDVNISSIGNLDFLVYDTGGSKWRNRTPANARTDLGVAIGTNVQAYDATLTAFAAYNTNGLLTQTAADTFTGRTLTGGGGITVTNGDGVSGNPTLSVSQLKTIWIPAGAMRPSQTGGCAALALVASGASQPDISSLDFDATTAEYAQFYINLPKGWNAGTVTAQFVWSHPATTTNFGVVWTLQAVSVADNEAMAVAYGTLQQIADTGGTTDRQYVTSATPAITIGGTPATGETQYFRVGRLTSDGSDTMAVDARLHGIKLFYTITTMDDT